MFGLRVPELMGYRAQRPQLSVAAERRTTMALELCPGLVCGDSGPRGDELMR